MLLLLLVCSLKSVWAGTVEETERNPEVFVKKLHYGRWEAFVAGHPSYSGQACKEMKRVVCLDFQLSHPLPGKLAS